MGRSNNFLREEGGRCDRRRHFVAGARVRRERAAELSPGPTAASSQQAAPPETWRPSASILLI